MLEKLKKILGKDFSTEAEAFEEIQRITNRNEELSETVNGLKDQLENTEQRLKKAVESQKSLTAEDYVTKLESETGRTLSDDRRKGLKRRISRYMEAENEETREEAWEDAKTYCYAFGVKEGFEKDLSLMSNGRDGESGMTDEEIRNSRAEKLRRDYGLSYSEAYDVVTDDESYEKFLQEQNLKSKNN